MVVAENSALRGDKEVAALLIDHEAQIGDLAIALVLHELEGSDGGLTERLDSARRVGSGDDLELEDDEGWGRGVQADCCEDLVVIIMAGPGGDPLLPDALAQLLEEVVLVREAGLNG